MTSSVHPGPPRPAFHSFLLFPLSSCPNSSSRRLADRPTIASRRHKSAPPRMTAIPHCTRRPRPLTIRDLFRLEVVLEHMSVVGKGLSLCIDLIGPFLYVPLFPFRSKSVAFPHNYPFCSSLLLWSPSLHSQSLGSTRTCTRTRTHSLSRYSSGP